MDKSAQRSRSIFLPLLREKFQWPLLTLSGGNRGRDLITGYSGGKIDARMVGLHLSSKKRSCSNGRGR